MLFESEQKALKFMEFNQDLMLEENGKAPIRAYYCEVCGGWHLTSHLYNGHYDQTRGSALMESVSLLLHMEELLREMKHADDTVTKFQLQREFQRIAERVGELPYRNQMKYERCLRQFKKLCVADSDEVRAKACHTRINEALLAFSEAMQAKDVKRGVGILSDFYDLIVEGEKQGYVNEEVQHYRQLAERMLSRLENLDTQLKFARLNQVIHGKLNVFWDLVYKFQVKKCTSLLLEISPMMDEVCQLATSEEEKRKLKHEVLEAIQALEACQQELREILVD